MIAFPRLKLLLFTPPRAASASLHAALCTPRYGGVAVVGSAGDNEPTTDHQHTTRIDPAHRDWRRAVVVRDELDRLVSLWHFWLLHEPSNKPRIDFDAFVRFTHDQHPQHSWLYTWTIQRWALALEPYQRLRWTHLEADLTALLGVPVQIPQRIHASARQPTETYYRDLETRRRAEEWAEDRFTVPDRLALIQRFPRWGVGVEVGTFRGEFAQKLLDVCQPEVLYLLDTWSHSLSWGPSIAPAGMPLEQEIVAGDQAYREVRERFAAEIVAGRVRLLHGPAAYWLPRLPKLDWVYIDADHSYEAVKHDLHMSWKRLKPCGWLAGHDYCKLFPGVQQAVDEFCAQHDQRINVFAAEQPVAVLGHDEPVAYSSYAVRKN